MNETPDYETFTTRPGRNKWAKDFVATLVAGEPQRVPIANSEATKGLPQNRYGTPIRMAANSVGLKVTVRTMFDGELWACLLRDEDVNGK